MRMLTLMMASKAPVEGGETNTIYIDTLSATNGTGTIGNPKNTLVGITITNDHTYKLKCGTTYTTSTVLDLSGKTGVTFTKYGTGDLPKFSFTGTGTCAIRFAGSTNCTLSYLDIYTDITKSVIAVIQLGTGTGFDGGTENTITNCKIHNVKQGVEDGGIGIRGGGTNLLITNNEVYDCGNDGMYLRDTVNLNVGYNIIYNVSQNYAGASKGFLSVGTGSGGDGIQLGGTWPNFRIHHNIIDRTDEWTGNKFGVIFNSAAGINATNGGIFEHNIVRTKAGADVTYCVYGEQGNGIIIRYNRIQGATAGVRVTGVYCLNYLIHSNIFTDCVGAGSAIGIINGGGYPTNTLIYNNVFARGGTSQYILHTGGNVIVKNNIFDDAITAFVSTGGTYTKAYNCLQDPTKMGTGGLGTYGINGDPLFVDADNDDFHLQSTSLCRGSGIGVGIVEDFDGSIVPTLNMGVYFN